MKKFVDKVQAFIVRKPREAAIALLVCAGGWAWSAGLVVILWTGK